MDVHYTSHIDTARTGFGAATNTLAEIVKLQSDAEYIKRDVSELRTDVRDVRDRMARLEERVLHLPGKGFIVMVVTTALVIIGGLVTIAPKPQALLQTATRHG
jgi:hypothetical protein